jgi:uncharacterized DUF497 family protein
MPTFVWDPAKADRNLRKHGVSFEDASRVFDDPFALDDIDDREDYGEERSNIIGMVDDQLLVITYALRGGKTRIISARPAEPIERRRYHDEKR